MKRYRNGIQHKIFSKLFFDCIALDCNVTSVMSARCILTLLVELGGLLTIFEGSKPLSKQKRRDNEIYPKFSFVDNTGCLIKDA